MDTTKLNESITFINKMEFNQIWSGANYTAQRDSLNDIMTKLNNCVQDINLFDEALIKLKEYIKICERIKELYNALSSCSSSHTKRQNEIGCIKCGNYTYEIYQKENLRKALRKEIIAMLSKFVGISIELEGPTNYNPKTDEKIEETNIPDNILDYDPLAITNPDFDGLLLTPAQGRKYNGPQAEETWYDLNMGYVVERMETEYGIPIESWIDSETGLKMCRKVGEDKEYVMVAADVHSIWSGKDSNPDATYSMGDIVLTSWGEGMIVDYCGEAVEYRKAGKANRFDIAVAWSPSENCDHRSYYSDGMSYSTTVNEEYKKNQSEEEKK